MSSEKDDIEEDPMIGDILSSIKSIINEDDEEEEEMMQDIAPEPEPDPAPAPEAPAPAAPAPVVAAPEIPDLIDDEFEDSIISSATAEIGAQQFVKLNNMIRMGNSNVTLSDIVRSLLRPMLREWLDENLPAMVEQKVEYEIKRLVNRVEEG